MKILHVDTMTNGDVEYVVRMSSQEAGLTLTYLQDERYPCYFDYTDSSEIAIIRTAYTEQIEKWFDMLLEDLSDVVWMVSDIRHYGIMKELTVKASPEAITKLWAKLGQHIRYFNTGTWNAYYEYFDNVKILLPQERLYDFLKVGLK